jgi:hypothetical protein
LTEPVADLLDGTDSASDIPSEASVEEGGSPDSNDGTPTPEAGGTTIDIPSEAFEPPVNSTALRQGHSDTLKEAGSFTFEEEYSVGRTDADRLIIDETITVSFNLDSGQSLRETSTTDTTLTVYGTGTEKYARIEDSSGDVQYDIPDGDIGPGPYLESDIFAMLETIDVEHQKTDAGHVYSASGVDAVSEGFPEADADSFQSFEFEAIVSEKGVLKEFSFQTEIVDSGEVFTGTRSGELKEIGTTEVREPTWLDDARQATS